MDLFTTDHTLTPIPLEDGELAFLTQLPMALGNDEIMARLIAQTDWRSESITLWGKQFLQPRLTAWHGDKPYTYSGLTMVPAPWTPLLAELRAAVEAATGRQFNSVLLNYYRNERDSMGMHSDDEAELGPEPAIASVSFGATRTFILRHKASKRSVKLPLTSGSMLLMAGRTQANWAHGINKETRSCGPRLNLTFRKII
jgi:alkylated DNA repair dioxygenase AlkB